MFIILNVVHWIGCIWYYLGFTLGIDPTVTSWTKIPSMMDTAENLATGMTQLSRKYIRSVYFAVVSITTVGYGDIACSNVPETIFNIFVVLVSSGLFSALAGSMEMRLQVLERHTTDYRRMVALFNQFSESREFPLQLKERVISHYTLEWNRKKDVDEDVVLRDLPLVLRNEVEVFIKKEIIDRIHVFRCLPIELVHELAAALTFQEYLPGEIVIEEGSIGTDIYFIHSGRCRVYNNHRDFDIEKKGGDIVGERGFFGEDTRKANVQAMEKCKVYVLSTASFTEALANFPSHLEKIKQEWKS